MKLGIASVYNFYQSLYCIQFLTQADQDLKLRFWKYGPQNSSLSITWKLIRNENALRCWIRNPQEMGANLSYNRSSRWNWCPLQFENDHLKALKCPF